MGRERRDCRSSTAAFNFRSSWEVDAPRTAVWDALVDFESWQKWWPGLEELTPTRPGGPDGVGLSAQSRWRGPIGYQLQFSVEAVEIRPQELLRGRAEGDLTGQGLWQLGEKDGWTSIQLDWDVDATRKWMEFLAPVARPVFVHGHDYVMEQGAIGLAEYLGVEIRGFHSAG
jgi:uncharacterized protein YndB with AHSA1/START domain